MPDQIETEDLEPETNSRPTADDDRKAAYRDRDAAKKRAREAEAKARELEEWKAAREAEQAEREAEAERKKNDFAALEKRLQKERDDARREAAEAKALIESRQRFDREAALVDAVMPKLGTMPRNVVKGILRILGDSGVDIAPEALDDKLVTDVAKKVREELGELAPAKNGGSSGTPGVNLTTKPKGEKPDDDPRLARLDEIAKRRSRR